MIIPPELASDVLKAVDEYIINEVICISAKEITPEEIRKQFEDEQRKRNPTIRIYVKDK